MATPVPFDDPVLGRVDWDCERGEWRLSLALPTGRAVPVSITPEDARLPLRDQGIVEIRNRLSWVRENEPLIRSRIADKLFQHWWDNWYDEEIDEVTTVEGFRDAITLDGINVYEDGLPRVIYRDGGLYSGHAIWVRIGEDGQFEHDPEIFG